MVACETSVSIVPVVFVSPARKLLMTQSINQLIRCSFILIDSVQNRTHVLFLVEFLTYSLFGVAYYYIGSSYFILIKEEKLK